MSLLEPIEGDRVAKQGYRGIHVQVDLGAGTSAEIQIMPKRSIDSGGFDFDHQMYDKWKRVDRDTMSIDQRIQMEKDLAEGWRRLNEDWRHIQHRFQSP